MSGVTILVIVFAVAVLTAGASYVVFKAMGVEVRRRHLEVGTAIFLQLGVIYAVFLAFVFGQALTSFVAADNAIDTECAALHGASIVAASFPPQAAGKLASAMDGYIKAVVDNEWTTMRETRHASQKVVDREEAMIRTATTLDLPGEKDVRNQARVVEMLMEAHASREARIFEAGQGIPAGLWLMILFYCGILVGLVFFSSLEYAASHAVLSGIFGGLNALILLAVFALQYPFEGPFRLSPESFVRTQAKIATTFAR